jgi:hypothetical protein
MQRGKKPKRKILLSSGMQNEGRTMKYAFIICLLLMSMAFADNITISKNQTITYSYAKATAPLGDFSNIFGFLLIIIGIFMTIKYAMMSFN